MKNDFYVVMFHLGTVKYIFHTIKSNTHIKKESSIQSFKLPVQLC